MLGEIAVQVRATSSSPSIRRHKGRWLLIVPPGADMKRVAEWVDSVAPELLRRLGKKSAGERLFSFERPAVIGVESERMRTVRILPDALNRPAEIYAQRGKDGLAIFVGKNIDIESLDGQGYVSRMLLKVAQLYAPEILFPEAEAIAARVGDAPSAWSVSKGSKTLGRCNSRREIALSVYCVFLTRELREYIICHELAHLREMNHSAAFHRLCDSYLGGREASLEKKLREYRWPVMK